MLIFSFDRVFHRVILHLCIVTLSVKYGYTVGFWNMFLLLPVLVIHVFPKGDNYWPKKQILHHVHKTPPLHAVMNHRSPIGIFTPNFLKIYFSTILLYVPRFPKWLFMWGLSRQKICNVSVEELKTNLMSLVVFISLIFAQHVSNINMSIFRSLRLWWWLTTSVILFCKDRCFSN